MNAPKWLDTLLYPFAHNTYRASAGNIHYIDEGTGDPIVFVHGTPAWSFVWRQQIRSLSRNFRCIAPDHIGFGLSDKPADFEYTPEAHALNLEALLEHLQLKNITLVVHDFGGSIGLYYALKYPQKVKALVILNTWMWSLENETQIMKASQFMSGSIGKFLYTRLNFSPRFLLPRGYSEQKYLTKDVHRHYLKPFPTSQSRMGAWRFATELKQSGKYFEALWQQRDKLKGIPILIIWGEKDKLLPFHFLDKWKQAYPAAQVITFKAGHFVQEEKGGEVADAMHKFILEK